ncbi:MAG: S8 family peptidase [Planctomycetota bacterium]|nr:S8 family peptidase [Planctomycetota bacterium]
MYPTRTFVRTTRQFGLLTGVLLLVPLAAAIADHDRFRVTGMPARVDTRLSPELNVLLSVGGRLIGRMDDGSAMIDRPEGAPRVQDTITTVSAGAFDIAGAAANSRSLTTRISMQLAPATTIPDEAFHELLVTYENGKRPTDAALAQSGFRLVSDYPIGEFLLVEPIEGLEDKQVRSLAALGNISAMSLNYEQTLNLPANPPPLREAIRSFASANATRIPNDPRLSEMWGMRNVNAAQAWARTVGEDVIVGVIDTGVNYRHEDLRDNMWRNPREVLNNRDDDGNGIVDDIHGAAFFNNRNRSGDPMDQQGHGTHCAGTIGAVGNNGVGVVGVNWKVKIMALRFLGRDGGGSTFDAIRCIDYAVGKGVKILSNSWGGGGSTPQLQQAIQRAERAGVLFVAAAGNDTQNIDTNGSFPAGYSNPNILSIAAIAEDNSLARFSNYGRSNVDMAAPGVNILSTGFPSPTYRLLSGTSMATPHVAGAAALIWNRVSGGNRALTVKRLLMQNARRERSLLGKCVTEATLDLSFVGTSDSGQPPSGGGPQPVPNPNPGQRPPTVTQNGIAQTTFTTATRISVGSDILAAKLTLKCESWVAVKASASAAATTQPTTLATGFSTASLNNGKLIPQSMRLVSVDRGEDYSPFGSQVMLRLPAGDHTIHWTFNTTGQSRSLNFRGGALLLAMAQPVKTANSSDGTGGNSTPPNNSSEISKFVASIFQRDTIRDGNTAKSAKALLSIFEHMAEVNPSTTTMQAVVIDMQKHMSAFVDNVESFDAQTPWAEALAELERLILSDVGTDVGKFKQLINSDVVPVLRGILR